MKIQEAYDKYQHLDKLLSSCGDEEFTLVILRDLWLSIKRELDKS